MIQLRTDQESIGPAVFQMTMAVIAGDDTYFFYPNDHLLVFAEHRR